MLLQLLILVCLLYILPMAAGMLPAAFVEKYQKNILFMWICGTIEVWAFFQVLSVPFIIREKGFQEMATYYGYLCIALAGIGILVWIIRIKKYPFYRLVSAESNDKKNLTKFFWGIFIVLLLMQVGAAAFLAFADGDDAYYVATSLISLDSNTMYEKLPYTGGFTGLEMRHAVAPFPVWISFLAKISGMHAGVISHIVLPIVLIPMTYAIYGLIGRKIYPRNEKMFPVYMIFVSILVLWGNYSISTTETFLITRTRQGKAALGNVIIPFLIFLLLLMGEKIQEKKKVPLTYWYIAINLVTAACLCSALGAFLAAMLLGVFCLCQIACNKQWRLVLPTLLSCIPAIVFVGIYALLK